MRIPGYPGRGKRLILVGCLLAAALAGGAALWRQEQAARDRIAQDKALAATWAKYAALRDQILTTGIYFRTDEDLGRALRLAAGIGGITPQNAADAVRIDRAGQPLTEAEFKALLQWLALGKGGSATDYLPQHFEARRAKFLQALHHPGFEAWLAAEWEKWQSLAGGRPFSRATEETELTLSGTAPAASQAAQRENERREAALHHPRTAEDRALVAEEQATEDAKARRTEFWLRVQRSKEMPMDGDDQRTPR